MTVRTPSILLVAAFLAALAVLAGPARGGAARPAGAPGPAHVSQATPAVSGTVFADANANGVRDSGEAGLAGWTVFVDLHGSGVLAADDPSAMTAPDGSYSIGSVPSGSYIVRTVQQPGFSCTLLSGCIVMQSFPATQTLLADFGEASTSAIPPGILTPPPGATPPPPPRLGKTFTSGVVSGVVLVELPAGTLISGARAAARVRAKGRGFVRLTEPRSLPVGSVLDTTRGTARILTAVDDAGLTQSGDFGAGVFTVLQNRREQGLAEVRLMLTRSARLCPRIGKVRTAARRLLPRSVLALLRADAHGKFRTRGRYSSATVRGTSWDTAERCDGTLTTVRRGAVAVLDLRRRRTVLITAGRSYLARAG